jgi:L-ascorbate metabolism protein UlaG (beta-lactamase superfamily)
MDITWLGHSCFRIKGSQTTVITDPFPPELGYAAASLTAPVVTVSHQHPDHSYLSSVTPGARVVKGPGEYEISSALIIGLASFHDKEEGRKLGKNTVYAIQLDELSICHLGDLGHVLSSQQVEDIGNVDILMVPVGDVTTINSSEAAQVVRQLEPKVVLPMHYKTPAVKMDLEPIDRFLKEMGVKDTTSRPKLTITKGNLPATTQVILLDY